MVKASTKFILKIVALILIVFSIALYSSRHFSQKELDDVTPEISCEKNLLDKSNVLWIVPIFENKSIAEDKVWCDGVLALNKTLGLHGVYHTYQEFGLERNEDYIDVG